MWASPEANQSMDLAPGPPLLVLASFLLSRTLKGLAPRTSNSPPQSFLSRLERVTGASLSNLLEDSLTTKGEGQGSSFRQVVPRGSCPGIALTRGEGGGVQRSWAAQTKA